MGRRDQTRRGEGGLAAASASNAGDDVFRAADPTSSQSTARPCSRPLLRLPLPQARGRRRPTLRPALHLRHAPARAHAAEGVPVPIPPRQLTFSCRPSTPTHNANEMRRREYGSTEISDTWRRGARRRYVSLNYCGLGLPPPDGREPGLALPRQPRRTIVVGKLDKPCARHVAAPGLEIMIGAITVAAPPFLVVPARV